MGRQLDSEAGRKAVHDRAVRSLFAMFEEMCEGALAVDEKSRIVWITKNTSHF